MFIRKGLPGNYWNKLDNKIFTLDMSPGAKVLYAFLLSTHDGAVWTDEAIKDALGISRNTLLRQKKELRENNLLLVEQIQPRIYVAYLGHTNKSAEKVKLEWKKEDGLSKLFKDKK